MPEIGWFTAFGIYVICWWMALFMVLPIGVRNLDEAGVSPDGSERGAPAEPLLRKKLIWASGLGFVFFGLVLAFIAINPLGF